MNGVGTCFLSLLPFAAAAENSGVLSCTRPLELRAALLLRLIGATQPATASQQNNAGADGRKERFQAAGFSPLLDVDIVRCNRLCNRRCVFAVLVIMQPMLSPVAQNASKAFSGC
jgi:hypothetical protein